MKNLAGSYEALFSRRAMKYKSLGLGKMDLKEADYKNISWKNIPFLKRPVFIIDDYISIGNSKKTIEKFGRPSKQIKTYCLDFQVFIITS